MFEQNRYDIKSIQSRQVSSQLNTILIDGFDLYQLYLIVVLTYSLKKTIRWNRIELYVPVYEVQFLTYNYHQKYNQVFVMFNRLLMILLSMKMRKRSLKDIMQSKETRNQMLVISKYSKVVVENLLKKSIGIEVVRNMYKQNQSVTVE